MTELIPVSKAGDYLEVHPTTLAGHKAAGWVECPKREPAEPAHAMSAAELKEALTAKGIEFRGSASKADLQALLDAA